MEKRWEESVKKDVRREQNKYERKKRACNRKKKQQKKRKLYNEKPIKGIKENGIKRKREKREEKNNRLKTR